MEDSYNTSIAEDSSFNSTSPESGVEKESPKAKDWQRILHKSEAQELKNLCINDNIHGHFQVPDICRAVIDTPQFDRLRGIRQLGTVHYVYPCAKHTRWEHSVGVMHLAGEFVAALRHPDRGHPGSCDLKDQYCVMLAGLCHDLGHGPFSHLWEDFVCEARPGFKWRHEQTSIDMLDYIIKENNLEPVFEKHGFGATDLLFIKELISGPMGEDGSYLGRGLDKLFLYEIVANKISSIDVDKWDYFLRDNQALNVGLTFDHRRFILMAQLKQLDGTTRLAFAEKEALNVQKLFEDRARLHEQGYQHRVVKKIDRMVIDALLSADNHIDICFNREGERMSLSGACGDMFAFSQLTDEYLLNSILHSRLPQLQPAAQIIHRIATRRLYKIIGNVESRIVKLSDRLADYEKGLQERVDREGVLLQPHDLVLSVKRISTGLGRQNPVEKVLFFDSRGNCKHYNSKYLKEMMNLERETVLVMLRRQGAAQAREAEGIVRSWAEEYFAGEEFEFSCAH